MGVGETLTLKPSLLARIPTYVLSKLGTNLLSAR